MKFNFRIHSTTDWRVDLYFHKMIFRTTDFNSYSVKDEYGYWNASTYDYLISNAICAKQIDLFEFSLEILAF